MPKMKWSHCSVCEKFFGSDEEWLEIVIESSKLPEGMRPHKMLVRTDSDDNATIIQKSEWWHVGGWMTTRAVCMGCVTKLPEDWRKLFKRPQLSDWIPVEKLGENAERGTETWKVRRKI
jgi:hypothetical protein